MATQQEVQRDVQFQQLMASMEQVQEMLVNSSSQLTAIANQALQIRQHLQQLKANAPAPLQLDPPVEKEEE